MTTVGIEIETRVAVFFDKDNGVITDTDTHRAKELLNCRARTSDLALFDVVNSCNQAVTIEVTAGNRNEVGGVGGSGLTYSVAANTREPIFVDALGPYTGILASYAVAPTSGQLEVIGSIDAQKIVGI